MTCLRGTSASNRRKSAMNSAERCWRRTIPRTVPVCTSKAASRSAVPWRTYSNSRRAGWPGATAWLGAQGVRTPMPVFSSTQKVGPSVGGCSSSSITSTALGTKSGSRSSIQESKAVQAQVVRPQDAPHGARAGGAQAQLGVRLDVLRQVGDRPVRLPHPAHLGRGLARQDHNGCLLGGRIAAGRGAVRAIAQPSQALRGKAVPLVLHGVAGQTQRRGNGRVARAVGGPQHNLRPPRLLLGAGAGTDDPLHLRPLLWAKHDRTCDTTHGVLLSG